MAAGQQAALGQVPGLHPRPRKRPPTRPAPPSSRKAGISGKGMLDFFGKLQNQEYRLAIYSKDSSTATHPLSSERIQALEQKLQERSRLEQADRPGARSTLPAGQGKADRLSSIPKQRSSNIPRATRACRRIMRAPMPITSAAIPTKRSRRRTRCSRPTPHDPYFLELKGQILLEAGKPKDAIPLLREAVAALRRSAADSRDARPCAGRDRGPQEFRRGQANAQSRGQSRQRGSVRLVSAGHHLRPRRRRCARAAWRRPSAATSRASPSLPWPAPKWRCAAYRANTPDWLRAQDIAMVSRAELAKKDKRYLRKRKKTVTQTHRSSLFGCGGRGGNNRVGAHRRAVVLRGPAISRQPNRPAGDAVRSQDPLRHGRCAARFAICAGAQHQPRRDRNAVRQAPGKAPRSPR